MELALNLAQEKIVRVVTIKHPPAALEGSAADHSAIGKIYEVPAPLAIRMMAAGWVRSDTRSRIRRFREQTPGLDRRQCADRRSVVE
jgi:hypothetical protein